MPLPVKWATFLIWWVFFHFQDYFWWRDCHLRHQKLVHTCIKQMCKINKQFLYFNSSRIAILHIEYIQHNIFWYFGMYTCLLIYLMCPVCIYSVWSSQDNDCECIHRWKAKAHVHCWSSSETSPRCVSCLQVASTPSKVDTNYIQANLGCGIAIRGGGRASVMCGRTDFCSPKARAWHSGKTCPQQESKTSRLITHLMQLDDCVTREPPWLNGRVWLLTRCKTDFQKDRKC